MIGNRRFCAVAIVAAFALALPGCGDGDGGSAGGGTTRADFLAEANAICTAARREGVQAMSAYARANPVPGQSLQERLAAALQNAFLPELQRRMREIGELEPPAGDEGRVAAFLAAAERAIEKSSNGAAAFADQFDATFARSARLARDYGLSRCVFG